MPWTLTQSAARAFGQLVNVLGSSPAGRRRFDRARLNAAAIERTGMDAYLHWTSSHWGWVLGAVILCVVVLAGFFLSLSATGETEDID